MQLLAWVLVLLSMEIVRRMAVFEYRRQQREEHDDRPSEAPLAGSPAPVSAAPPEPAAHAHRWLLFALLVVSAVTLAVALPGHSDLPERFDQARNVAAKAIDSLRGDDPTHTVRAGDTCWGIAANRELDLAELQQLNGLSDEDCRQMRPGEKLRLPKTIG